MKRWIFFLAPLIVILLVGVWMWRLGSVVPRAPSPVRVEVTQGNAKWKHATDESWSVVSSQTKLSPGDEMEVGENSEVAIYWTTGSVTRLSAGTQIVIGKQLTDLLLLNGRAWSHLRGLAPGEHLEIDTPSVQTVALGTTFAIDTAASGDGRVTVIDGAVAVKSKKKTELVVDRQTLFFSVKESLPPEKTSSTAAWIDVELRKDAQLDDRVAQTEAERWSFRFSGDTSSRDTASGGSTAKRSFTSAKIVRDPFADIANSPFVIGMHLSMARPETRASVLAAFVERDLDLVATDKTLNDFYRSALKETPAALELILADFEARNTLIVSAEEEAREIATLRGYVEDAGSSAIRTLEMIALKREVDRLLIHSEKTDTSKLLRDISSRRTDFELEHLAGTSLPNADWGYVDVLIMQARLTNVVKDATDGVLKSDAVLTIFPSPPESIGTPTSSGAIPSTPIITAPVTKIIPTKKTVPKVQTIPTSVSGTPTSVGPTGTVPTISSPSPLSPEPAPPVPTTSTPAPTKRVLTGVVLTSLVSTTITAPNQSAALSATATYADGTTADVLPKCAWSTSNAVIGNVVNQAFLSGQGVGTVIVTCDYSENGITKSGSETFRVVDLQYQRIHRSSGGQ